MSAGPRYALYYVPLQASTLASFGARCIGYDIWSGDTVPFHDVAGYARSAQAFSREPARYGFHATLKAPFHLTEGLTERDLLSAAADFAAARDAVALGRLEVRALHRFMALMPVAPPPALAELAAACVMTFDPLRAPLSEEDRARRLATPLTDRQRANLDAWGYPHVLEDFRFHMTLTGPLDAPEIVRLQPVLGALWAEIETPVMLDGLTLAVQPTRHSQIRAPAHFPFRRAS